MVKRWKYQESEDAINRGRNKAFKETGKALWGFVVDVGDMAFTTAWQLDAVLSGKSWHQADRNVEKFYSFVSGKENIGLLNERNETLQGVTSSILYTINELTLQHPRDKIIKDAIQAGKQVKESLLDPIATSFSDVSHYTGTVEEHEQVGYGHGTFILLAVDAILANLTRGSSLKKRKGPDTSSNNKNSKTDTADTDRKNGVMGPHNPNGGISNYGKGATVYNGRFKTGGSVLGRVMRTLEIQLIR